MLHFGLSLIASAGPAFLGVLHALHAQLIRDYHDVLMVAPLTPPRSLVEKRHLRQQCADCAMLAEMISVV